MKTANIIRFSAAAFIAAFAWNAHAINLTDKTLSQISSTSYRVVVLPGNGTITTDFTCDSSTHSCACQGAADCFDLGNSQLCKDGTYKPDEQKIEAATCTFKF